MTKKLSESQGTSLVPKSSLWVPEDRIDMKVRKIGIADSPGNLLSSSHFEN